MKMKICDVFFFILKDLGIFYIRGNIFFNNILLNILIEIKKK